MTTDSAPDTILPAELPHVVRAYLTAHGAGDAEAAARTFTPRAVVVDQGRTFTGAEEVLGFLRTAGSEFTYTSTVLGARREDDDQWVVAVRLEGNFPGGVATVDHRFRVTGELISELTIG